MNLGIISPSHDAAGIKYVASLGLGYAEFDVNGDIYKVKSHSEITRVEKNGKLLYESVPGTLVKKFLFNERECTFLIEGAGNTQVTMELEPETEYNILIGGENVGASRSNRSSKLSFSAELNKIPKALRIERI